MRARWLPLLGCVLVALAFVLAACGDDDDEGGGAIEVVGNEGIDKGAPNYRSLAQQMKTEGADCFVYSGITANNAVQLFKDVAAALPDAKLFGPDGVAEAAFSDPGEGGVPANVAERTLVTVATLSPDQYPPEGKKFFEDFQAEYGEDNPDPYAIYGFEAASLVLGAIERAAQGGNANEIDRNKVIDELFATENRESVLGTYSIDDNGDTTITDYGAYEIKDGELSFREVIKAEAPTPPKTGGPAGGEKPPVSGSTAKAKGGTLTLYSSLPQQGAARVQTEAVQNGIKLALKTAGNKAGPFTIEYKPLDDSTAQAGSWDPGATGQNARRVVGDDSAVAYIGEFNSGASVISMPILNKAGVPQVSPANTAVGLTADEPGADQGEPGKYYSNKRHYVRVSPKDTIQGAALATLMQQEGCTKVFIANDKEVYGAGLARNIELAMEEL